MADRTITLETVSPLDVFGPGDSHLKWLEKRFPLTRITARGETIKLTGPEDELDGLQRIFSDMASMIRHGRSVTERDVRTLIALVPEERDSAARMWGGDAEPRLDGLESQERRRRPGEDRRSPGEERRGGGEERRSGGEERKGHVDAILYTHSGEPVIAKTPGQKAIVEACAANDIVFAIGPAGTGKTFTSVALAVEALKSRKVKKIILARPAVEAGETLGFLPGAIKEKIDPYLRPLYDALEEMIDHDRLEFNLAKNIIEIAPLAYMRGRTLNNAFVILDEAQNATHAQMKMFLTRIGFNSRAIITGDITQTDLPKTATSGLVSIQQILTSIEGISFVYLDGRDVVRHRLVREIISAYERFEEP